jgi:hypothetical protein
MGLHTVFYMSDYNYNNEYWSQLQVYDNQCEIPSRSSRWQYLRNLAWDGLAKPDLSFRPEEIKSMGSTYE